MKELNTSADEMADKLGRRIRECQLKCPAKHEMRASPVYAFGSERKCTTCGTTNMVGLAMAICQACKLSLCIKCALTPQAGTEEKEPGMTEADKVIEKQRKSVVDS